jgi:hypothetical protein
MKSNSRYSIEFISPYGKGSYTFPITWGKVQAYYWLRDELKRRYSVHTLTNTKLFCEGETVYIV